MNNLFVTNPIKVNILSFDKSNAIFIGKLLVFVGIVPKNVKLELKKLGTCTEKEIARVNFSGKKEFDMKKIKNKFPNIKKFYGNNWIERLGIDRILDSKTSVSKKIIKTGGDVENKEDDPDVDFNFDSPVGLDIDVDDLLSDISKRKKNILDDTSTSLVNTSSSRMNASARNNLGGEEDMNFDQNYDDTEETEEILEANIEDIFKDRKSNIKVKYSLGMIKIQWIFDDLKIYPFDKISEFKLKIFSVTGIRPYKQHLWTTHKGQNYPLSYSIMKSHIPIYEPIDDLIYKYKICKTKEAAMDDTADINCQQIENIPVKIDYYNNKDVLKVESNDTFRLLMYYYSKYGTTSYNLLSIDELLTPQVNEKLRALFKNDKYQKDMFYYSFVLLYWPIITLEVFYTYYKDGSWEEYYPELNPDRTKIKNKFAKEREITDQCELLYNIKNKNKLKIIEKNTEISITSSIISILQMKDSKEPTIYLRNIFDYFPLDLYVDFCKAKLLHNGKAITMKKAFNKNPLATTEQIFGVFHPAYNKITLNSMLFRIRLNPEKTTQSLYLNLFQNGNYTVMASWQEELNYGFDDIYKITESVVNPIIKKINSLGSTVLYYEDNKICMMSKQIAKFTEISLSTFWNSSISNSQFNIIRQIAEEYAQAGIIRPNISDEETLGYYFSKGMHCFDATRIEKVVSLTNYYEYLSNGVVQQKWNSIFNKTRVTEIHHRLNSIKIDIMGVQMEEYEIFLMYIKVLFFIYLQRCSVQLSGCFRVAEQTKVSLSERMKRKTLTDNKQQDPELYNSKKLYKTDFIYSRVCQKPYQPIMLSMDEYEYLDAEQKERAVKFWNFTSEIPVYYLSINPKYKYIKFMTNKHPKKYCVPCSFKTPITSNKKDLKRIMHEACLSEHKWEGEKKTITEKSRYIMSYGKAIENNRLSRLPEKSLEPLFFDTYTTAGPLDQECVTGSVIGYYLYGVQQNLSNISKIGYAFSLSHALGYTIEKFLSECKKRIKETPDNFKILLNGNVYGYFSGHKDLISTLDLIEKGSILSGLTLTQMGDKWNELFESIAFVYFAINTIKFEDRSSKSEMADNNIELILPPRLSSADTFVHSTHKNLIILKKVHGTIYYPIYNINTELFYKTRIIDVKLFETKSEIIQTLRSIVVMKFKSVHINNINLSIINQFIRSAQNDKKWKLGNLFINKNNYCYTVELTASSQKLYIPVKLSFYSTHKGLIYEPLNPYKYKNDMKILNKFLSSFNLWIAKISEAAGFINYDIPKSKPLEQRVEPIIPYITITSWILLGDTKSSKKPYVIGFANEDLIFYISPISVNVAQKIKKVSFTMMRNDPYKVNIAIFKYSIARTNALNKGDQRGLYEDKRSREINKSIYKHYLYNLFLLEFITLFNKKKNDALRTTIKSIIVKTNFTDDIDELGDNLKKIVHDSKDMQRISLYISNFLNKHHDKKKLLESINLTRFNFDVILLDKLKSMDRIELKAELSKLSKKIICVGKAKYTGLENILIPCSTHDSGIQKGYCSKKKLIVPSDKLKTYIDILASDILNPMKSKWIFSSIFTEKVITYFKFIRRPFEIIQILLI